MKVAITIFNMSTSSSPVYLIGVDVGTGSARAALVTGKGEVLQTCVKPIQTWNTQPNYYEQSSDDIWSAVCECVKVIFSVCVYVCVCMGCKYA